ncbi:MAG TPA: alpha/beta hydrolase family protein [Acetobacteraceae bacterium]|jgi:pimeloyl-ACP methyl ester carboxylesterase|nr:alpha/beta hydrolase family protein [Acetobacteraceae bacterium]
MAAIVLIHGAYQGGWIWQRVVRRLTADGHTVFAPSLDGCAERRHALRPGITTETHGAEIAELLFFEDLHDVVLVGTSSGGMVVCSAAEQARERIGRLVFADALALFDGESIGDIVQRRNAVTTELTTGPSREDAAGRMFAGLDEATKAWALERYTPHPVAAMHQPVKLPGFWQQKWRASVVWCRQAVNPGEAHQRRAADRLGATWHELDTGHYPMVTAADELSRLIVQG